MTIELPFLSGNKEAGSRLLEAVVARRGRVPRSELGPLTLEAGYPTAGSWGGYLNGFLARDGEDVVLSEACWRFVASLFGQAILSRPEKELADLWNAAKAPSK